jgi:hypothetical protein
VSGGLLIRISDLRGKPVTGPALEGNGDRPPELEDETIRRLLAAERRLLKLVAPSEYRALMADVGLALLSRRATVADVVGRIDAELERAEKAMAEARAQVRALAVKEALGQTAVQAANETFEAHPLTGTGTAE